MTPMGGHLLGQDAFGLSVQSLPMCALSSNRDEALERELLARRLDRLRPLLEAALRIGPLGASRGGLRDDLPELVPRQLLLREATHRLRLAPREDRSPGALA